MPPAIEQLLERVGGPRRLAMMGVGIADKLFVTFDERIPEAAANPVLVYMARRGDKGGGLGQLVGRTRMGSQCEKGNAKGGGGLHGGLLGQVSLKPRRPGARAL